MMAEKTGGLCHTGGIVGSAGISLNYYKVTFPLNPSASCGKEDVASGLERRR